MEYSKINYDFIEAYCIEHKEVKWLKNTMLTPTADGKRITFIALKKAFVEKFMPEIAPKAKSKKPSMFDRVAAL